MLLFSCAFHSANLGLNLYSLPRSTVSYLSKYQCITSSLPFLQLGSILGYLLRTFSITQGLINDNFGYNYPPCCICTNFVTELKEYTNVGLVFAVHIQGLILLNRHVPNDSDWLSQYRRMTYMPDCPAIQFNQSEDPNEVELPFLCCCDQLSVL